MAAGSGPGGAQPQGADPGGSGISGGTLLLHLDGRRSVALRYVARAETIYLVPSASRTRWSTELVRRGTAVITLPDATEQTASVHLVVDAEEAEQALGGFRRVHGEKAWERYFAGRPKVIALRSGDTRGPPGTEELLRSEFDAVAARYTKAVQSDPVDAYLRERSTAALLRRFEGLDPLLEIGCGTGNETLPLLAAGHRVTAIDISPEMLKEIRARARTAGVGDRLVTIEGRLRDLRKILDSTSGGDFAGAYSTFGAFNLEPDLSDVSGALRAHLAPRSPVFLATLNRHAVMPLLVAATSGRFHELRARLSNPIPAAGSRFPLDVFPLSVRKVENLFSPGFQLESVQAGSVLSPPDDLPRMRRRIGPRGLAAFRSWDAWLATTRWGTELAEWQFITLRSTRGSPG